MMNLIRRQFESRQARRVAMGFGFAGFMAVLSWSGVVAFQRQAQPVPLAATEKADERPAASSHFLHDRLGDRPAPSFSLQADVPSYEEVGVVPATIDAPNEQAVTRITRPFAQPGVKFDRLGNAITVNGKPWTGEVFDHRPIRAVKSRTMKTTAYSPDEKSCGKWADGITASGKSVWMNGGRLVAADRAIPYGTILTIPGYNDGKPIQVWDRGGAIKGNRLDLLYPTHEIALQWGVQDKQVVFWEYVETD